MRSAVAVALAGCAVAGRVEAKVALELWRQARARRPRPQRLAPRLPWDGRSPLKLDVGRPPVLDDLSADLPAGASIRLGAAELR